jgi:hypothetical protein
MLLKATILDEIEACIVRSKHSLRLDLADKHGANRRLAEPRQCTIELTLFEIKSVVRYRDNRGGGGSEVGKREKDVGSLPQRAKYNKKLH